MEWFNSHLLTGLTFLPLVWAAVGTLLPEKTVKHWAFAGSIVVFLLSLKLYTGYDPQGAEFQFLESAEWIPGLGVNYSLGMDGISMWLILLTTFLSPLVILSSYQGVEDREKSYYTLLLALQTGMTGAFVAMDTFLFYVFWEAMLIPMYFLIGIWGGKERIYAAMKFFIFTMVGSLLMLVAIFFLAYQHKLQFGNFSTALLDLYKVKLDGAGYFSTQGLLFLAFALAFAIKVPLFPLHTWLPDAHVQAPTAGSVILAGVLLKMGGYGFIRFAFPLFPQAVATYQHTFLILGSIAIVYGAWVAMVQPDMKKLVAYSSVSHMGYVVIGLFALNSIGATGSVYQMLNHGISTPALFLMVGMLYERRHTKEIKEYGGITKVMPLFAVAFMIATLSSVALPGTNGFVGEFLILLGAFKANPGLAVLATTGVIFGAVYMLWMFQRVMFGPLTNPENKKLKDLSLREACVLTPLLVAMIVMGVVPNFFFEKMETSVAKLLERTGKVEMVAQTAIRKDGK
ncbi:MAG: NADH-quinone oxidoreductase subunit M [Bdellovibrionales bacterium]|nr:NADH-quinone oxidoreductase subunit M [Bdellovibrionales bacterium]